MPLLSLIAVETLLVAMGLIAVLLMMKDDNRNCHKRLLKYEVMGSCVGLALGMLAGGPRNVELMLAFALMGLLAAALIYLFCLVCKQVWREKTPTLYYDDGTPPKFYITGDKHRDFGKIKAFCRDMQTRKKDVLIILGDSGFNYYGDKRDDKLKADVSKLNITLFCLHGNKENRPQNIGTYGIRDFCGGKVYYEPKYPRIYFAMDGETYTFEGKKYMVVGGAHSVDKMKCLEKGLPFFDDEMPDDTIKSSVEKSLAREHNKIYGMLTHTCPLKYLPTEMFVSTHQNAVVKQKPQKANSKKFLKPDIDRSTEEWLNTLEEKVDYSVWFCGHYHIDKQIDKIYMLYHDIRPLHLHLFGDEKWNG